MAPQSVDITTPSSPVARKRLHNLSLIGQWLIVLAWVQIGVSLFAALAVTQITTESDSFYTETEHPYILAGIGIGLAGISLGVFMLTLGMLTCYIADRDEANLDA